MAKTLNPMDAFRREQKKKELKKHKQERQVAKQSKLSSMDPVELQEQVKKLDRQLQMNPNDGPMRKRKQELEDTLKAVKKKRQEMEREQQAASAATGAEPKARMTAAELKAANIERYQSPENSIYYHPTLNPFGAPPPGKPQMYHTPPPPPPSSATDRPQGRPGAMGPNRGPPPPPGAGYSQRGMPPRRSAPGRGHAPPMPAAPPTRPGKRPPLPSGPPPPGTIQVPPRPPLPSGAVPFRPPPPPPSSMPPPPQKSTLPLPPPPAPVAPPAPPVTSLYQESVLHEAMDEQMEQDDGSNSVIAPYPTSSGAYGDEQEEDEKAQEEKARLRSLVPVALRVQRRPPQLGSAKPTAHDSVKLQPVPQPAVALVPAPSVSAEDTSDASVSKEYERFMEEMKRTGAL